MKLLMLGPPGAGKGTMATLLAKALSVPHISTGEMLRQEVKSGSALGNKVKNVIESGELVNDALMIEIAEARLKQADCQNGFILDGLPRTLPQAKGLDAIDVKFDHVVVLDVNDDLVESRLTGRRVHPASGRTYHVDTNPPKTPGVDDVTGETLVQRQDDTPETVKRRLAVYHEQTKPLVEYYHDIALHIDGSGSVDTVLQSLLAALK